MNDVQNDPDGDGKDDQPLDGDVIGPSGTVSEGKDGASKRSKKGGKTFARTSGQSEEDRKRENEAHSIYRSVVLANGFEGRKNPDYEPTEQQREVVRKLAFAGYTQEDIAYVCGFSVEKLVFWFEYELKASLKVAMADLASRALSRARDGDATLTMFLLKTRGGFVEQRPITQAGQAIDKELDKVADPGTRATLLSQVYDLIKSTKKAAPEAAEETTATVTQGKGPTT